MNKDTVTTSTAPISARVKPSFFRGSILKAFGAMNLGHLRLGWPTAPSMISAPTPTP